MKITEVSRDHAYARRRGWLGPNGANSGAVADVQEDGSSVVSPVIALDAGHGLDITDEGGGVAGIAVDETELDGSLIPGIDVGLGAPDEGAYLKQYQNAQARLVLTKEGTFRDPLLVGLGTVTAGSPTTVVDDTKYHAWPQVARMRDGRLLAAWVRANNHNLDNSGQVYGMIGTEALAGTITWGTPYLIASDASYGTINVGLGVLHSGRVVLSYNLYNYPTTPVDSVRVIYSDDHGATWSSPYTVNSSFTSTSDNGTSRIVQRSDGAVLLAIYGKNSGDAHYSSHLLFSTDDGATFGGEVTIANGVTDGREYVEPSLLVLDNQTVLSVIRTNDGGGGDMYQTTSTDGGATWAAASGSFAGYSPANLLQLSSGTVVSVIRGDAAALPELFTSVDRGTTWVSQGTLASGFTEMEYACPVELLNAKGVLVVYSKQPTSSLTNADIATVSFVENVTDLRTSSITSFATPAIVLGTAAAAGSGSSVIRHNSTIVAFDATVPTTSAEGDSAATGSAAVAARRDHKHGREAFGTTTAAIGTSAGGSATTPSKSDHVHATGAGTPTTSAIGDAAATGTGPAAAMTDHVHGREALSTATPLVESGSGAVGTGTKSSREDHVHPALSSGSAFSIVGQETRTSDGSTTTWLLDNDFEEYSVQAFNLTTGVALTVTETLPNSVTISAAGTAGQVLSFAYAASTV